MRAKRALVLGAIMAIVLAGLPAAAPAATHCRSCCAEMIPCCQMAPVAPATPPRADRQAVAPQPATGQTTELVVRTASFTPVPHARVGNRYARQLRSVVLRI